MAQLFCTKVEEGLRPAEATVTILEYDGRPQYLPVDRELLSHHGRSSYLPVRVMRIDPARKLALISLPVEADSGANRLWVELGKQLIFEEVHGTPDAGYSGMYAVQGPAPKAAKTKRAGR